MTKCDDPRVGKLSGSRSKGRRAALWAAVLGVAAVPLAACSSSGSPGAASPSSTAASSSSAAAPSAASDLAAMVPAAIRSAGELTVPTDADYPPFEFLGTDNKTITGLSADLMQAILSQLGLKPNIQVVSFESIIPGFSANRWQVSLAAVNVTPERAKVVDFVTYDRGGDIFYEPASGTLNLPAGYSAVCGHTVGVLEGSSQAADAQAEAAHCTSVGKSAHILQYGTQAAVNLAVQSRRVDFGAASNSLIGYLVKTNGSQFKTASKAFNFTSITGFAVSKTSGMAKPILAALKKLMQDGTYQRIMAKWGQQTGDLSNPSIVS